MTLVTINQDPNNPTMFGTFFVKGPDHSKQGGYSSQSIYPSTYSTLTPSSELRSLHYISDDDSNGSSVQDLVDNYGDQVYLLNRQPKHRSSSKLRKLSYATSTDNRPLEILQSFGSNLIDTISSSLILPKISTISSQADIDIDFLNEDNSFQFLSITHRKPFNLVTFIALFYSYIPFLSCLMVIPLSYRLGPLFAIYIGIYCTFITVINEITFKKFFKQPRPKRSLVKSYGMPSTHSMVSYCLLTLLILESLYLPEWKLFSPKELILCCIILVPVPWGRLYLEDHTFYQCGFGCLEGILFGVLGFQLRRMTVTL